MVCVAACLPPSSPAQEGPPLVCVPLEGGAVGVGIGKELQRRHVGVQAVHRVLVVAADAQVPAAAAARRR